MTTTRAKAREILWENGLQPLKIRHRLPIKLTHEENQLMVQHANGSKIWLLGVPDQGEIDKVRGGKYFRAVIDEAQAFPDWLETLINDSVEPALLDYDGDLAITGTPGVDLAGFYYEVCSGQKPGWEVHDDWTALDNPYLPGAARWLAERAAELGEDNPTYQREYMGRWVQDHDALVYPFTRERNGWTPQSDETPYGLPPGDYEFGLGVDLGWSEQSTAFTLVAKPYGSGKLYFLRSWARTRVTPQTVGAIVQQIELEVRNAAGKPIRTVVDEGGLGQGWAAQLLEWGILCEAAKKTEKRAHQDWMKGLILSGSIRVHYSQCVPLIDECRKLPFDPETGQESDRYRRHNADSALYISRAMLPRYDPKENMPEPGTDEFIRMQLRQEKAKLARKLQKKREGKTFG